MTELKKYSAEELKQILDLHAKWRRGEAGGARANLAGANLAGANLADAYLAGADLADADLADADLAGAYLAGADLADANLARANLADAYLAGAYLAGADLADANLARANLADADLAGADLAGAYLAGADLAGADLAGADLAGAYLAGADLARAYLAGADLAGADLADVRNAPADLTEAVAKPETPEANKSRAERLAGHAERYRKNHPDVPVVASLDKRILDVVRSGEGVLAMDQWHTCETTHCRAGWAITLAGKPGKELESKFGSERAGAMIYRASTGRVPYFFDTNERALEDIKRCAEESES